MVTIETTAERQDGVTLVTATMRAEGGPKRVTVESRLDGPVWPPRRQGKPAAGWESEGDGREPAPTYEGVVPADESLAIGFASPAVPREPPVAVTNVEPAPENAEEMSTPAAVLRGLGDPSPPSPIDVDELPEADPVTGTSPADPATEDAAPADAARSPVPEGVDGAESGTDRSTTLAGRDEATDRTRDRPKPLPPAPAEWLATVERRIEYAEGLEATASVEAATAALRECDGVAGARTLEATIATDADALRALAERAERLAERAESASIATDELERLP